MSEKHYPKPLRKIVFYGEDQDREFTFLTNVFSLDALQVALLYKNRWQIELFFKWMKQHLNIQKFWGVTENAVRIQIYSRVTTPKETPKNSTSTPNVLEVFESLLSENKKS
jgi:hypothetical protein